MFARMSRRIPQPLFQNPARRIMPRKGDSMMRGLTFMILGAAFGSSASIAASVDSYLTIKGVSRAAPAGPIYLQVSAADLDGDGVADGGVLRIDCAAGALRSASLQGAVTGPREATSGLATGKRQHGTITLVKEWGPATPQLSAMRPTWDIKKMEGGRTAADDGWTDVALSNADGLCPAAETAAKAYKTRSNIQNN
jgi:hypothetical protein